MYKFDSIISKKRRVISWNYNFWWTVKIKQIGIVSV